MLRTLFKQLLEAVVAPVFLLLATAIAAGIGSCCRKNGRRPRLVWGPDPIANNIYWSRAMRTHGMVSETYTTTYYASINTRSDWDSVADERYRLLFGPLKYYAAFIESLLRFDIFFLPCQGFFLGRTMCWRCEAFLFRLAGKKSVLLPYGADAYVYRRVRSTALQHGLQISYPLASRRQRAIAQRVDYWVENADVFIAGIMGADGFGRTDVLLPSKLHLDIEAWLPSTRCSDADGRDNTVYVAHAPNHRGFKGTEFIIAAINQLRAEGLQIELVLIEGMQNTQVREMLRTDIDILVEQVVATGHGLNALEGMASALPVISNLEDDDYLLPMRRWSFFGECPIVSATPEGLVETLRKLVGRPELRAQLGAAGRAYVEKYHGLDSAQYLFGEIVGYLQGQRKSLENLYHPLLGEYPRRKPPVSHPLRRNRLVD